MDNVKITVTSNIDIPKKLRKINDPTFWTFAANEWHRLITPFTPFRDGFLSREVDITPKKIHYAMPYARYVYNMNANFRKDIHPLASKEWDKAAIAAGKAGELISSMQNYVDSGKLGMND